MGLLLMVIVGFGPEQRSNESVSLTHKEKNLKDDRGIYLTGTFYESLRSMLSAEVGSKFLFAKVQAHSLY